MSNTIQDSSSHYQTMIKKVTIEVGNDEEIKDSENFQDIRMEMNSVGHNLTSVLMNPRETFIEDIFDEFSTEQSAPLEHQSPFSNANGSTNALLISNSIHSSVHKKSSHHSVHATPTNGASSDLYAAGTNLFTMTVNESEQLERFIIRMAKVFAAYYYTHSDALGTNASSPRASKHSKKGGDDLRNCYSVVPPVFFLPDFSLASQDVFGQIFETVNAEEIIDKIRARHNQSNTQTVEDHLQIRTPTKSHSPRATSKATDKDSPDAAVQTLQDHLSQYLDLVEMALLRQIYARSPAFFRSLDDIKSLQSQVSDTTQHLVTNVRGKLQATDVNASSHALVIPKMARRQTNIATLSDKLGSMQQVVRARAEILLQLEAEDYIAALELISLAKNTYYGSGLDAIHALKAIGNQLNDYDNLVCEIMCNKFVSMAIQWEEDTVTAAAAAAASSGNKGGSGRDSADYDEFNTPTSLNSSSNNNNLVSVEKSLRQLLNSLVVTERVQSALNMYKHRLLEAIRLIVRTCVLEYLVNFDMRVFGEGDFDDAGPEAGGGDTPFQQRVKEMSHENFLSCMSMCYEHVILSLTKASVFHSFIEQELSEDPTPSSNPSPLPSDLRPDGSSGSSSSQKVLRANMIVISKQCLSSACDLAQRSISKLITLRKENNSKLSPANMKLLWQMSLHFILQLENIYVSTAYVLRQCLLAQTTSFLKYLHETNKGKLVNTLDNERFTQCDVGPERQDEINKLVSGKSFIAATAANSSLTHAGSLGSLDGILNSMTGPGAATSAAPSSATGAFKASLKDKQVKPVIIDSNEYRVVWSALLLVEFILIYLEIAFNFSPATDIVIKCIVDLMDLFDTRTNALVLGAEAIQSAARLKSISAKHLALTGQSISLIVTLIPHIRAALLAQLPVKQQMQVVSLETCSQKYNDHHNKIVSKFVSIVSDFVDASATKLKGFNWDINTNDECQYFVELKRNVTALHTVLLSVLPVAQIQEVFSRIFALLNRKIPQHFEEIMPLESAGKDRITDAISDLIVNFTRLRHLDAKTLTLEETFNRRYRGIQ